MWPHGRKATELSAFIHILHVVSSFNFWYSSCRRVSSEDRLSEIRTCEKLPVNNYVPRNTLIECTCVCLLVLPSSPAADGFDRSSSNSGTATSSSSVPFSDGAVARNGNATSLTVAELAAFFFLRFLFFFLRRPFFGV